MESGTAFQADRFRGSAIGVMKSGATIRTLRSNSLGRRAAARGRFVHRCLTVQIHLSDHGKRNMVLA